jgi:hypothetical protein
MLAGNAAFVDTSYDSIATTTVGAGGVSSITFSSIPSTYQHLQVRMIARTNRGVAGEFLKVVFNSDTSSIYTTHQLWGDGTSALAFANTGQAFTNINRFTGSPAAANVFGSAYMDILDYTNTNKNKTIRTLGGYDDNSTGEMYFCSGLWQSTAAINSITISPGGGTTLNQYSSFALYGIKG